MSVFKLIAWFSGYVVVKVTGGRLREFIFKLSVSDIKLWDLKNITDGFIIVNMYVDDYKLFCKISRKYGCKDTVIDRFGLPFFINKFKKRYVLTVGMILFVLCMYLLSSIIWKIEISGLEYTNKDVILNELDDMGITKWKRISDINNNMIANELMMRLEDMAWVGVEHKGTVLSITFVEKTLPDHSAGVYDLVATKNGILSKFIPLSGIPLVKEGDTVTKGQVLVEGIEKYESGESIIPRAVVEASVWYRTETQVPLTVETRTRTGRESSYIDINLFGLKLRIGRVPDYSAYDLTRHVNRYLERRNGAYSVEIIKSTMYELNMENYSISLEEARSMALKMTYDELMTRLPENAEIVSIDHDSQTYFDNGNYIEAWTIAESLEDISGLMKR